MMQKVKKMCVFTILCMLVFGMFGCTGKIFVNELSNKIGQVDKVYCKGEEISISDVSAGMLSPNGENGVKYKEYSGDMGSTARRKFEFYDIDGNLLFSITDVGNRNIIDVTIGEQERTYQYGIQ